MLFKSKKIKADYMQKEQIMRYLQAKLKYHFGFDYEVFIRTEITENQLRITIDETTMTDDMYNALEEFKHLYYLNSDEDVFFELLNQQYGGNYQFHHLVVDLEGVYIIREKRSKRKNQDNYIPKPLRFNVTMQP